MLDVIRANAQSWGVKVAFAIIIIVFVFWGVGSFTGGPSTVILTVNGEPITIQDFQGRYEQFERSVREQRPDLDAAALKKLGLRRQLMDSMILESLLLQEAERVGITVTPVELRQVIESYPVFQNAEGKFDPDKYLEIIKAQRDTPGNFEARVRNGLLIDKLRSEITAGAYVNETELHNLYLYEGERRIVEYALFPLDDYAAKVNVTPEEIQAYYDANQTQFSVPPQADVEYLLIGAGTIADPASVTEDQIKAYYDKHPEQYSYPEQYHARHILILADEKAPAEIQDKAKNQIQELEKRIRAGEDFAELAKEYSQDGSAAQGGDLGWFTANQMVAPFSAATAALKPGEVSSPVQTTFGYHLIKLEDKKLAGITPLADASDSIRTRLAQEAAVGKVQDALEQVQLAIIGGKSLKDAGAPLKLEPKETGLVNTSSLATLLGLKPENVTSILAAKPGTTLETPFMTKDGYLVVNIKESHPQSIRSLDEVKEEIITGLKTTKAREQALAEAQNVRKSFSEQAPQAVTTRLTKSAPFGREGYIPGLGINRDLAKDAFNTKPGSWLPVAYALDGGAVLAKVAEVITPAEENWEAAAPQLTGAILNARREQMFTHFLDLLRRSAKIELRNETILNE